MTTDNVIIRNLDDIKRVIAHLDPSRDSSRPPVDLGASWESNGEKYAVSTTTISKTRRQYLLEGFDIIKKRLDTDFSSPGDVIVNGRHMRQLGLSNGIDATCWVDPIIKKWYGAVRDGLLMVWQLGEHRYEYDIYTHSLVEKGGNR